MNILGKMLVASGAKSNPMQLEEMQKLRSRSFVATNVIAILLLTSLILMSIVKYL
jgi:hypothetical protein